MAVLVAHDRLNGDAGPTPECCDLETAGVGTAPPEVLDEIDAPLAPLLSL
ncbi:MAG TPA: hypothetical protein VEK12_02500 [Alphaproteobacteria bacterium]|nr:hypothetical protein [Alphaproteobacteria bacterium]